MKSLVAHMLFESDVFFVPVGYVFTTDRNTEFYKSTEGWKNQLTDKMVTDKMEERLEMAATEEIKKYNTEHPEGKIGDAYTDTDGVAYYYTGDDFVSREGVSLDPELSDKALRYIAKQNKPSTQKAQKQVSDQKPNVGKVAPKDKGENKVPPKQPSPAPEKSETKPTPRNVAKKTPTKTPTQPVTDKVVDIGVSEELNKLVGAIKQHPQRSKIKALLQKGDEVSLLAADIIMYGKNDEAKMLIQRKLGAQ